jgi:8-oxo-dGTP pyrophosphatase MutT (NUDIX family)
MLSIHRGYTQATLCLPIRGDEVLLAEKQKKIGAGLLNGFGGKVEADDKTIYDTNVRETEEEIGIRVKAAKKVGEIVFRNPSDDNELKKMIVYFFTATEWDGEPMETEEMKQIAWYKIADLDYDRFLPADRLFMPQILSGKYVKGVIEYNDDWSIKTSSIDEVEGF